MWSILTTLFNTHILTISYKQTLLIEIISDSGVKAIIIITTAKNTSQECTTQKF